MCYQRAGPGNCTPGPLHEREGDIGPRSLGMRAQQLFNDEWIWKFKTWRLHKECGVRPRVIHIMGLTKRREGLYRSSAGCRPPAC